MAAAMDFGGKVDAVMADDAGLDRDLTRLSEDIMELRSRLVATSRSNFILEKEVEDLDHKINLLLRNLITIHDIVSTSNRAQDHGSSSATLPLKHTRKDFENLFFELQNDTDIFALLASKVQGADIPSYVETVVFDMYGDQYDTREERLLLTLFRKVLRAEFSKGQNDIGSLMRHNSAVTKMLSAYARRGQGLNILKSTLAEPLAGIVEDASLNLELDPNKIHAGIVADFETASGEKWSGPNTPEENTEVHDIIQKRTVDLIALTTRLLHRIFDSVDKIPYGIRWVCRELHLLAKEFFPAASDRQVASIVGGFIFLRFFNPAILTPDANKFVKNKLTKRARRNVTLMAKCLQNLSNGVRFGDKEQYMKVANPLLDQEEPNMLAYFERLCDVDDLEIELVLDKYMPNAGVNCPEIHTTVNQVYTIHRLLVQNMEILCPTPNSKLYQILEDLGSVKPCVAPADNIPVTLKLVNRFRNESFSGNDIDGISSDVTASPVFETARRLLSKVLLAVPKSLFADATCLEELFEMASDWAEEKKNQRLVDEVANVDGMLQKLMHISTESKSRHLTTEAFLTSLAENSLQRQKTMQQLKKRHALILEGIAALQSHEDTLRDQLDYYETYLDNVRKGQTQAKASQTKAFKETFIYSHKRLEDKKVIEWTDPSVHKALSRMSYRFTWLGDGNFKVEVIFTKRGGKLPGIKPMILSMEDLLSHQKEQKSTIHVGELKLNVNLLLYTINKKFLLQGQKKVKGLKNKPN